MPRVRCIMLCWLLLPFLGWADDGELRADLHEEIVQVPMVFDGFFGKKALQLTATSKIAL